MAHELENMFSVRQVPWHGLGNIVSEAPSAEEAIKLAGLDWKVEKMPIAFDAGATLKNGIDYRPIAKHFALVRSTDQSVLAVMKDSYQPLQNEKAFSFFNPFVESGLASFETAGSLKKGKVVWVLATLNKAPIDVGGGDYVKKNLLLSNSHDGTMAIRVGFTPIRVVCNNTLTFAIDNKESRLIRIKHSGKIEQRLDQVQEIVNAMDAKFEATAEQYKALAKSNVNTKDLENYVNIVFELRENGTEREQMRAKKMRETITNLFENGAGANLKSARGTRWGLYNAVTEYLTHDKGKDAEERLFTNWFGQQMRQNKMALDLALEAV